MASITSVLFFSLPALIVAFNSLDTKAQGCIIIADVNKLIAATHMPA